MNQRWLVVACLLLLCRTDVLSRQSEMTAAVTVRGNYISSAKVFFNPDAASEDLRSEYLSVYDLVGAGFEIRISIPQERIFFTVSTDYLARVRDATFLLAVNGTLQRVSGTEGLKFIPVELAMNTYIPIGSEDFQLSMGGGVGAYYAIQTLTILNAKTQVTNSPVGYGIHINTGIEYRLNPSIRVRSELKFRDPEIINENRYEQQTVNSPFRTKIQVNGLSLSVGMVMDLF